MYFKKRALTFHYQGQPWEKKKNYTNLKTVQRGAKRPAWRLLSSPGKGLGAEERGIARMGFLVKVLSSYPLVDSYSLAGSMLI